MARFTEALLRRFVRARCSFSSKSEVTLGDTFVLALALALLLLLACLALGVAVAVAVVVAAPGSTSRTVAGQGAVAAPACPRAAASLWWRIHSRCEFVTQQGSQSVLCIQGASA